MSSWRRTAVGEWILAIPPMIRGIMVACVVIWLAELTTFRYAQDLWIRLALVPSDVLGGHVWQLITYQFLHDPLGIAHLLFNMWALWMFGRELEPRWGPFRFLLFYLTCGVGGGLVFVLLAALGGGGLAMGASAAVLGVTMAFAMIWPHRQLLMFFVVPMQARHAVILIALVELLLAWSAANGLANFAHLGGMATAWIYLRWGRRLTAWPRNLGRRLDDMKWAWRKRRMKVVDKDWDRILRDDDDRGRRH